jgi:hypothetical protein
MVESLSYVMFCRDDTTLTYHSDAYSELLFLANSIAVFRKFIDLCNESRILFNDIWFEAFEDECLYNYGDDPSFVYVMMDETSEEGVIKWAEEIPTSTIDRSKGIDYESDTPQANADLLVEILQKKVTYISSLTADKYFLAAKYQQPMDYMFHSLKNLIEINALPKKCKNCGKYFIPEKRSDAIYCDRQSPQNPNLTCKRQGGYQQWENTVQNDEKAKLYRLIYMARHMAAKRNPDNIPAFEWFKSESKRWKKDVKSSIKTEDEYLAWLKAVKEKRVN